MGVRRMSDQRRHELQAILAERLGELNYDMQRNKYEFLRLREELIRTEDAIQELSAADSAPADFKRYNR